MTTQQMFYERAVPLTRSRHGEWSVEIRPEFGFASHASSVPIAAVEFPLAAPEYPIVFAGTEDATMPAAILGVRSDQNLYVGADGAWRAKYVPAFVRRYPFVFASSEDRKTLTLCIDEAYPGCNQEGRGERLFDAEGSHTQYLDTVVNFLKEYQVQYLRTRAFCNRLKELGILEPMQAQFTLPGGARRGMTGFMAVNRTKLKALDGDKLADMARNDELELIYLHLHSLHNFGRMLERIGAQAHKPPAAEGDEGPADLGGDAAPALH